MGFGLYLKVFWDKTCFFCICASVAFLKTFVSFAEIHVIQIGMGETLISGVTGNLCIGHNS